MKSQLSILSTRNECNSRFRNKHKNGGDRNVNGDDGNGVVVMMSGSAS